MKKKLLIISYYFPPFDCMASKRWSEMIPELEKQFDIYVFTNNCEGTGNLPTFLDENKIKRIGTIQNHLFIEKKPKISLFRKISYKLIYTFIRNMRTINPNIFKWYLKNKKVYKEFCLKIDPDIIVTTTPEFSSLLFGLHSKKRNKDILWITDIRDSISMCNIEKKNFITRIIDSSIDKYIITKSDMILTVSKTLSELLSDFYKKKVYVIYNGFHTLAKNNITHSKSEKIIYLYYSGVIYNHREEAFFLLLKTIKNLKNVIFNIRLLGEIERRNRYKNFIKENNITNVNIKDPIDNLEVIKEQMESDILILFEELKTTSLVGKGTLTGKLFEYLAAVKPILAICRPDSEIGDILKKTESGVICKNEIEIINYMKNYKNIKPDLEEIKKFTRSEQAKKLVNYIDSSLNKV